MTNGDKKHWEPMRGEDSPHDRQVRAIEYLAYCLDRIEGHLEILATATRSQQKNAVAMAILKLAPGENAEKKKNQAAPAQKR
jgi:hypothetical protein